jgi:nitroreductase
VEIMKKFWAILLALAVTVLFCAQAGADIKLPEPQTQGGIGIFEALKKRSSTAGGDFSVAEVSLEELSTVLWAASGLNRGEAGWTVPMSKGKPPYCKIYVAGQDGVWVYDWKTHSLLEQSKDNIKAQVGRQAFVKKASYILVIVSDPEILKTFNDPQVEFEFAAVLTGAMTQNIYLAAAALKLGARYIHEMRLEDIKAALKLGEGEIPICLMLLGK